jgi:hypothetical protein
MRLLLDTRSPDSRRRQTADLVSVLLVRIPTSTNKEMIQKDVVYNKKTQRKRSFHYKLGDVVAAVITNYIGHCMIN